MWCLGIGIKRETHLNLKLKKTIKDRVHSFKKLVKTFDREKIAIFTVLLFLFSFYLLNNIVSLVDFKENQWTVTRLVPAAAPHRLGIDFYENYQYGKLVLDGKSPYSIGCIYPPFETVFFSPLALFPYETAYVLQVILLFIISLLCIYCSVEIGSHVFPGLNKNNASLQKPFVFLFSAFALISSYGFMFNLERGNYDLFALFFSVLFLLLIIKYPQSLWLQVIALSIAAHLKIYPAVLFVLLFWKHKQKALIPAAFVNVAFLFVLGPVCLAEFAKNMTKFAGNPYFWLGNHSAASFSRLLTDDLFFDFKSTKMLLTLTPLIVWMSGCVILLLRKFNPVNAVLFFCLSLPLMNLLPPVSHDYKLVLVGVPFTILFIGLLANFVVKAKNAALFELVLLLLIFGFTLRSWAATPLWFQNKYPLILALQILMYAIVLFPQGVFQLNKNVNFFDEHVKTSQKVILFFILPVLFFFATLVFIKLSTVIVTRDDRPQIEYVAKRTQIGLIKKQSRWMTNGCLLAEVNDRDLLVDIRFRNDSSEEKDAVTLAPVIFPDVFSMELLVKPAGQQSTFADIISNHPGFHWFEGLVIQQDGDNTNNFSFCFGTGTAWSRGVNFALEADKWNYVALNVEKNTVALYLNGQLMETLDAGGVLKNSGYPLDIGNWKDLTRPFSGLIREVRILNRLLTEAEMHGAWARVRKNFTDTADIVKPGQITAAEKMSGMVFLDVRTSLGLLRKGENVRAALLADINPEDLLMHAGFVEPLSGAKNTATVKSLVLSESFTVEVIVSPDLKQQSLANIISNHPGVNWYQGFTVQEDGTNTNTYAFFFGDGKDWSLPLKFTLEPGKWNYAAIEVQNDKMRLCLNGKFYDWLEAGRKYQNSDFPLDIGNWRSADRPFSGRIKEARISQGVLGDDVIVKTWEKIKSK
ncbi:MAG: glycosyltransferase 87 family protein [Candidatus Omnitrophica bacterium]|nr:glycosyltransferase 87 family protein [Candidatus Omnitrophota bacterium]